VWGKLILHLSPAVYDALQRFVHGSYSETIGSIVAGLDLRSGDRVIEIGCGTGGLSRYFSSIGCDYWGVEPDAERVAAARAANSAAHFVQGRAEAIRESGLPEFNRAFIHGMVHHIDDGATRAMLGQVFRTPGMRLVMIEPVLPQPVWLNPLGFALAKLDDGRFVRTAEAMEVLCHPYVRKRAMRSLMPRWPVPFLHLTLEAPRAA